MSYLSPTAALYSPQIFPTCTLSSVPSIKPPKHLEMFYLLDILDVLGDPDGLVEEDGLVEGGAGPNNTPQISGMSYLLDILDELAEPDGLVEEDGLVEGGAGPNKILQPGVKIFLCRYLTAQWGCQEKLR